MAASWTGTSEASLSHNPRTGSSGAWPRSKKADQPEGRGTQKSRNRDWIIREGPRRVWAKNFGLDHPGRKANSTGLDHQERNTKEMRKAEINNPTEEARTRTGGTGGHQGRDSQDKIILGNRGQDQEPNITISEEVDEDQDKRGENGDERAARTRSVGQSTKEKTHEMKGQPEQRAKRPRPEHRG